MHADERNVMSAVGMRPLEVVQRSAALGVRFWDVAGATDVIDGLVVEVFPRANPRLRRRARCSPSGVYVAHAVSGLHDFEFDRRESLTALWTAAQSGPLSKFRIEVTDPLGRFLPLAFDADLPVRGLLRGAALPLSPPLGWGLSPPFMPLASPPLLTEHIPLFSAPSRAVPPPLAVVYAQLAAQGSRQPLAWALLAVRIGGALRGLGVSDAAGRVAVMFPYPEPARRPLASPPEPRGDFGWDVALDAYCSQSTAPSPTPLATPDLADLLAQFDAPCAVIDSLTAPGSPPRAWMLSYPNAMTARTAGQPVGAASELLVAV